MLSKSLSGHPLRIDFFSALLAVHQMHLGTMLCFRAELVVDERRDGLEGEVVHGQFTIEIVQERCHDYSFLVANR
ncbi:hypothetical protein MA47_05560 [Corynebacterium auriscanis]|uniref:Uncharacterized protein n=1 Tax=Corynebacterium auriscanis TaxID=99807 RepID=A0A0A2DLG2_9CORY|nr:hypothetical protein MA47_05560 [Corynebacterium auriscanis]